MSSWLIHMCHTRPSLLTKLLDTLHPAHLTLNPKLCVTMPNCLQLCRSMFKCYVELCLAISEYAQLCLTISEYVQLHDPHYKRVSKSQKWVHEWVRDSFICVTHESWYRLLDTFLRLVVSLTCVPWLNSIRDTNEFVTHSYVSHTTLTINETVKTHSCVS